MCELHSIGRGKREMAKLGCEPMPPQLLVPETPLCDATRLMRERGASALDLGPDRRQRIRALGQCYGGDNVGAPSLFPVNEESVQESAVISNVLNSESAKFGASGGNIPLPHVSI